MRGRGGGHYNISRAARAFCGGRLRGHDPLLTPVPRAERGA